jgi:hypothetical protein
VTRTANLFTSLGGERPGVAYLLPTLVETHAVLWGAETAGHAVPMNFLLQPDDLHALLEASGPPSWSRSVRTPSWTSGRRRSSCGVGSRD